MNKVITAGGLIIVDNQVLLVKKNGKYVLPKGHLEDKETKEQAAIREVYEETGYRAKIIDYRGAITRLSKEDSGETVEKTIEIYNMQTLATNGVKQTGDSVWVDINNATQNMLYPEERDFLLAVTE